jgi:nucleotide-binding universal stress UspA family protein
MANMGQHLLGPGLPLLPAELLGAPKGLRRLGVATDFSLRAEYALARALRLPLGVGASLGILHVRAPEGPEAQGVVLPVERCLRRAGSAARRRLRAREDVTVREVVREGEPVAEAGAYTREAGTELLVVGRPFATERQRGPREGSAVRGMVRRVEAPVLVVVPHPVKPYQQPLVAVDLSADSRRALELTLRLCPAPMRVGVVHVFTPPQEQPADGPDARMVRLLREYAAEQAARAALGRFLAPYRETGREFALYVRGGELVEGLLDEATSLGADLLAVGMGEGAPGPVLAERVLEADCDVLVAKEPAA